jgi:peroxiredoxin
LTFLSVPRHTHNPYLRAILTSIAFVLQTSIGVLRSSFLVDEQGRIERAWHNVKADGHATKVLEALGPKV